MDVLNVFYRVWFVAQHTEMWRLFVETVRARRVYFTYISRSIHQTTICQTLSQIKWIIYWRMCARRARPLVRIYYLFASFSACIINIYIFLFAVSFVFFFFSHYFSSCALENVCTPSVDSTFSTHVMGRFFAVVVAFIFFISFQKFLRILHLAWELHGGDLQMRWDISYNLLKCIRFMHS